MATDARGHEVPSGSDFAQRKSLTDLSLSIPSIKSVASEAAATLYLAALSDAGITPSVANPVWAWRSDTQALMRHDGAAWEWVTPHDTGWVLIWSSGATYQIKARVIGKTLWVRAAVNDVSSGWTCPNKLPVEMRPTWTSDYVYALIAEGSGANNIAKMGVRADGSLWFRSYGSSTNIDGLTSVPL